MTALKHERNGASTLKEGAEIVRVTFSAGIFPRNLCISHHHHKEVSLTYNVLVLLLQEQTDASPSPCGSKYRSLIQLDLYPWAPLILGPTDKCAFSFLWSFNDPSSHSIPVYVYILWLRLQREDEAITWSSVATASTKLISTDTNHWFGQMKIEMWKYLFREAHAFEIPKHQGKYPTWESIKCTWWLWRYIPYTGDSVPYIILQYEFHFYAALLRCTSLYTQRLIFFLSFLWST